MEKTAMTATTTTTTKTRPITTFVQTDTLSFREVVQRLTGPDDDTPPSPGNNAKRPTPSLHERRQHYTRQRLEITKPNVLRFGPGIDDAGSLVSPSSRSNMRSPGTPATTPTPTSNFSKLSIAERRSRAAPSPLPIYAEEEERAIKERRFYLHPSPRSNELESEPEPELLNLFPLTSPTQ